MTAPEATAAASLIRLRRAELGELFRNGSARIPDGRGRGTVLVGTGGLLGRAVAWLAYAVAWRGKLVDSDAGRLKNLLSPFSIPAISAKVYVSPSWYDQLPCVVLDYSSTSWVARPVRDEIREVAPGVFLGLVFLGRRHVLDFALDFNG